MKFTIVFFALSSTIFACGGMDPKPDTNTPGMTPDTTDNSSQPLVIESCGDNRVTWLQGLWVSCPSDGESEAPEGMLEHFYQREGACFLSSDAVNGTLLAREIKSLNELMTINPNDNTPIGVYADKSAMTLTIFYAEDTDSPSMGQITCQIQ